MNNINYNPLIISAIGKPLVGRDTCMSFLADHLYDDGYRHIKNLDLTKDILNPICAAMLDKKWDTDDYKQRPIFLVNRLDSQDAYNTIAFWPSVIILHISRKTYKSGHIRSIENDEVLTPEWMYSIGSIPIRNDDSLELFDKQIKDTYLYSIKSHKNWKGTYEK